MSLSLRGFFTALLLLLATLLPTLVMDRPIGPKVEAPTEEAQASAAGSPSPQDDTGRVALTAAQVDAAGIASAPLTQSVPDAAVVWFAGSAWVYLQASPTVFVRTQVLQKSGVSRGAKTNRNTRLVIRGAQVLLAEERKSTDVFEAQ